MSFPYPTITIEEHWLSQHVKDFYKSKSAQDPYVEEGLLSYVIPALKEFGETRLKSMDDGGVALQVVSHAPVSVALDPDTCVRVNDELSSRVKSKPDRFAGFATLPMAHPEAASGELERCVKDLGFVGALIDSNCEGKYYDDSHYWPVFEAAEKLNVPIYLHPSPNEHLKTVLYEGNYPDAVAETLSQYAWGWHNETAVNFLRLFAAGLFDRYPKFKLVMGHMGEMLPFMLDRVEGIATRAWPHLGLKLERSLRHVWDENVWITTSGFFYMAPLASVLKQCKPDRIIYSVDYPFGSNEAGSEFLKRLKDESVVSDELLEAIAYKNAEKLLGLKVN